MYLVLRLYVYMPQGAQKNNSARVHWRGSIDWGGSSRPKDDGYYYIIELSTTADFEMLVDMCSLPISHVSHMNEGYHA